jgi:hypothetical protein
MKVLIGCPTCDKYSYCINQWLERIKSLIDFSKTLGIEADYLLVDNSESDIFFNSLKNKINIVRIPFISDVKSRIVFSRNILRQRAINQDYDYFLSIEQDIFVEKDILQRLLKHNKKIVSAYYGKYYRVEAQDNETKEIKEFILEIPVVWFQESADKIRRANPPEILNKGLVNIGGSGLGCILIHREVLKNLEFRIEKDSKAFDDMFFCIDAKKSGFELFLDSETRVEHLHR